MIFIPGIPAAPVTLPVAGEGTSEQQEATFTALLSCCHVDHRHGGEPGQELPACRFSHRSSDPRETGLEWLGVPGPNSQESRFLFH
jgi:hypothetical protein